MADARTITLALHGRWHGDYGLAFCPAHANTRTPALSLKNGDDGRLLVYCHTGCDHRAVFARLRDLEFVEGTGCWPPRAPAAQARGAAEARAVRQKKIRTARRLWTEALPLAGTLAERYLRRRAIRVDRPGSLRFHPNCPLGDVRRPAMIAAIVTGGEGVTGVHRTFLEEPGAKASDLDDAKKMLGACAGGAVRLSQGTGPLVVAEGVETALSVLDALAPHDPRVWAATSASGMAALRLPALSGELVVAPDADAPGRKAAEALAKRAEKEGWSVRLLSPPDGFKDWNDAAMARRVCHG